MGALARPEVGKYLNDHFAAAFQKVASFKIVNNQKQGGNVASYFCTPDGQVLHAIAGPVDGATLLREARWVVETRNLADLDGKDAAGLKAYFRKAHADRLLQEFGFRSKLAPRTEYTADDVAAVFDHGRGLDNAGRIHLLLSTYSLPPIGKVYKPIFERVLNEPVSTSPVQEGDAPLVKGGPPARVFEATAEEERESRREELVRKARNEPPPAEVRSGGALNLLLTDLSRLDAKGVALAETELDEAALTQIRVVANGHGDAGLGSLLIDPLPWPESLRLDEFAGDRGRVETTVQTALRQAAKGPVARDAVKAVTDALDRFDQDLTTKIRKNANEPGWTASDAIEAGTFLAQLKESAAVLRQPDVGGYLNGTYTAKGKTVRELVQYMATKGLRFAPALPGDEPAYRTVHRALAAADAKAHAAAE